MRAYTIKELEFLTDERKKSQNIWLDSVDTFLLWLKKQEENGKIEELLKESK